MDDMQFRDFTGSLVGGVTDVDDRTHQVQVRFPHNVTDSFKTQFAPDCFRESFAERLPQMCWQHDLRDPIGRAIHAQVLPTHNELIGQFSELSAVPSANRAYHQLKDETLTDFSFGFTGGKEYPHPDPQLRKMGVRQIPKAKMREFSPVTIGSIPGAVATGLREEGNTLMLTAADIFESMKLGLMSPEAGALALREQFPEFREHINLDYVRQRAMDDTGITRPAPMGANVGAAGAAGHGATGADGPEEYAAQAEAHSEACQAAASSGNGAVALAKLRLVQTAMTNAVAANTGTPQSIAAIERAKEAAVQASAAAMNAMEAAMFHGQGVGTPNAAPTASDVVDAVRRADPVMGEALSTRAQVIVAPHEWDVMFRSPEGQIMDGEGSEIDFGPSQPEEVVALAQTLHGALDETRQWLEGGNEDPAQALVLVNAARSASDALLEAMGVRASGDGDDDDDDDDMSDTPWESFSQSDYSPAQWREATLVDTGEGAEDSKDRYKLPVKEPNGKLNRHGLSAAASRLGEMDESDETKRAAAHKIAGLYQKAKKDVPPNVKRFLGSGNRAVNEDEVKAAQARLDRRLQRRSA